MQRLASGYTQRLASGLYRLGRDIFSPKARESKPNAGYTIIEVMIFLAISGFILIFSMSFLSGSEGHNRFSQSMRDTQSKIQDWLNDIPTGYGGGTIDTTGLRCQAVASGGSTRPKFNNGGGPDKAECIFLGKVIQFTDSNSPPIAGQDSEVFAYSVFGLRTYTPPAPANPRPSANLIEAAPVAAVGIGSYSGQGDLTEEYTLGGDTKVKSIVKSSGVASDKSHLGGFFLSFNQLNVANSGSNGVLSYQYPLPGNAFPGNDPGGNDVDQCISMTNAGSVDCSINSVLPTVLPANQWPPALSDWEICFNNDTNGDTALLTLSSVAKNGNGLGVTTKLEFKPC